MIQSTWFPLLSARHRTTLLSVAVNYSAGRRTSGGSAEEHDENQALANKHRYDNTCTLTRVHGRTTVAAAAGGGRGG